jgi:hypothetical protein
LSRRRQIALYDEEDTVAKSAKLAAPNILFITVGDGDGDGEDRDGGPESD